MTVCPKRVPKLPKDGEDREVRPAKTVIKSISDLKKKKKPTTTKE